VKRLSYIDDARCLKVNKHATTRNISIHFPYQYYGAGRSGVEGLDRPRPSPNVL